MTNDQITALAREYAEKDEPFVQIIQDDAEMFLRWLSERYCLVEKSRLKKLDIAYRAKHYGTVVLNQGDIDSIFPEIAKEVGE